MTFDLSSHFSTKNMVISGSRTIHLESSTFSPKISRSKQRSNYCRNLPKYQNMSKNGHFWGIAAPRFYFGLRDHIKIIKPIWNLIFSQPVYIFPYHTVVGISIFDFRYFFVHPSAGSPWALWRSHYRKDTKICKIDVPSNEKFLNLPKTLI